MPLRLSFWVWTLAILLRPIRSNDVWWQLASGRWILAHEQIPRVDVFSLTCRGRRWIDFEWLYQVILYGSYRAAGLYGVTALKTLLIAAALGLVLKRLRQAGAPLEAAVAAAVLIGSAASAGWTERADLTSLLLLAALFWALEGIRLGRLRPSLLAAFPPLFALWANLHAGFIIGLGVSGLYAVEFFRSRSMSRRFLAACGALALLATLATPYGWSLWAQIAASMRLVGRAPQSEFLPPPWDHMALFWIALAFHGLLLLRALQRRVSVNWIGLVVAAVLGWEACLHARFAPFFLVCALPFAVEASLGDPLWTRRRVKSAWLAGALAALTLLELPGTGFGVDPGRFPQGACDLVSAKKLGGRFYTAFSFGGYWVWRFAGEPAVFVDGRSSMVQGYPELWKEARQAQAGSPAGWQAFLDRHRLTAALMERPQGAAAEALLPLYFQPDRWALAYVDDLSMLFLRRADYPAHLAARR